MIHEIGPRNARRSWRVFSARLGREVEAQLAKRLTPRCPCCGDVLEAQPRSRLDRNLPLGARGYDLDCRDCRRFWIVVRHTPRSIRLLRMRRFIAAVRAAGARQAGSGAPPAAAPEITATAPA
jgi:hypothetical protein